MEEKVPIGELICQELKEQERSIAWLAKKVYYRYNTLCDILKRGSLDTDLLLRISKTLQYDFFAHYSVFLEERCTLIVKEANVVEKEKILIGNRIYQKLEEQDRSIAWLAKKAPHKYSALCKILKQNHIDTMLLLRISNALKYDFFIHYSAFLKGQGYS